MVGPTLWLSLEPWGFDMAHKLLISIVVACLVAGCTTSTSRLKPSEHALERNGVGAGDTVLLRYANQNDPKSSSRSEKVRLEVVGTDGVVGVNAHGDVVVATYDELFQVEAKQSALAMPDSLESAGTGVARALFFPLIAGCMVVAGEAADACLDLIPD